MAYFRFNPVWEFDKISKEMDRMYQHFSDHPFRGKVRGWKFNPDVDIYEDEKNLYFEVELPGIAKENVKVSINEDKILSIKGAKKFDMDSEAGTCCRNERLYGDFTRSFQLPELMDTENIEAKYDKGVLYLTIQKLKPVEPKEYEVAIN